MKYLCECCETEFKSDKTLEEVTCPKCGKTFSHDETVIRVIPTKKEISEFKNNLYHTLMFLSTHHEELSPRKKDSLATLKTNFFFYANEYNEGYFSERDEKNDRYCAWLVQEYRDEFEY